jgi:hypothetical protein
MCRHIGTAGLGIADHEPDLVWDDGGRGRMVLRQPKPWASAHSGQAGVRLR